MTHLFVIDGKLDTTTRLPTADTSLDEAAD